MKSKKLENISSGDFTTFAQILQILLIVLSVIQMPSKMQPPLPNKHKILCSLLPPLPILIPQNTFWKKNKQTAQTNLAILFKEEKKLLDMFQNPSTEPQNAEVELGRPVYPLGTCLHQWAGQTSATAVTSIEKQFVILVGNPIPMLKPRHCMFHSSFKSN